MPIDAASLADAAARLFRPHAAEPLHAVPCFAATGECGWLVQAARKNSGPVSKILGAVEDPRVSWELAMHAWWVDQARGELVLLCLGAQAMGGALPSIFDALGAGGALAALTQAAPNLLCLPCAQGAPCEVWETTPRQSFVLRAPHATTLRAMAYPPGWGPEAGAKAPFTQAPRALTSWAEPRQAAGGAPPSPFGSFAPEDLEALGSWAKRTAARAGTKVKEAVRSARKRTPKPAPPPDPRVAAAARLGVKWPGASRDEIVAAYRKAAFDAHPDRGGSHEAMAAINAARDLLTSQ